MPAFSHLSVPLFVKLSPEQQPLEFLPSMKSVRAAGRGWTEIQPNCAYSKLGPSAPDEVERNRQGSWGMAG